MLADGRVLIEGGEYNLGGPFSLTNHGAIYDPVADSWAQVDPPPGWDFIGDSASIVMPNGKFLLGDKLTMRMAELDPATMTWIELGSGGKSDFNAEEGWTLLPVDPDTAAPSGLYRSIVGDLGLPAGAVTGNPPALTWIDPADFKARGAAEVVAPGGVGLFSSHARAQDPGNEPATNLPQGTRLRITREAAPAADGTRIFAVTRLGTSVAGYVRGTGLAPRDSTPTVAWSLDRSGPLLSPNADGIGDALVVAARFSEPVTATLKVRNKAGSVVRSQTLTGNMPRFAWNLRDAAGRRSGTAATPGRCARRMPGATPASRSTGRSRSTTPPRRRRRRPTRRLAPPAGAQSRPPRLSVLTEARCNFPSSQVPHLALRSLTLGLRFILSFYIVKFLGFEANGIYGLAAGAVGSLPGALGWGLNYYTAREVVASSPEQGVARIRDRLVVTLSSLTAASIVSTAVALICGYSITFVYVLIAALVWLETLALDIHMPLVCLGKATAANALAFIRLASWVPPIVILGVLAPGTRTIDAVFLAWAIANLLALVALVYVCRGWNSGPRAALPDRLQVDQAAVIPLLAHLPERPRSHRPDLS